MKYTRKTDYTQQQLQDSLIDLLEEESFDKITIKQIVDQCHLNRSTFYRYYEDKYDLLQQIEEKLLGEMDREQPLNQTVSLESSVTHTQNLKEGIAFFDRHFREFHALLGPNCDRSFEVRMRQTYNRRYTKIVGGEHNVRVEFTRQVMIAMVMEAIQTWLTTTPRLSTSEVVDIIGPIFVEGPTNYLKELQENN